jgi:hypothetical protein
MPFLTRRNIQEMPNFDTTQTVLMHHQVRRILQTVLDQCSLYRGGNISAPEQ